MARVSSSNHSQTRFMHLVHVEIVVSVVSNIAIPWSFDKDSAKFLSSSKRRCRINQSIEIKCSVGFWFFGSESLGAGFELNKRKRSENRVFRYEKMKKTKELREMNPIT